MKSSYKLEDYKFQHTLQTRWKDLDAFRHINNAVFLSYIEDARIILLKRWKINYDKKSLIVASVNIDYLKQVNHPSSLAIGQRVSRLGNKIFRAIISLAILLELSFNATRGIFPVKSSIVI